MAVLLALCCCLSAVRGQWLEKTIKLPDSLGTFESSGEEQVWDSVANRLFLSGDSGVLVIDPMQRERLAIVKTGGKVGALCLDPVNHKVFCDLYEPSGGKIAVIDDRNDQIIDSISTGGTPGALCYDSRDDRIYCARSGDSGLTVIDGVTDSVLTTVPTGQGPSTLCYSTNGDKVFSADRYDIMVIGCDSDVALNRISISSPLSLCHNTREDKVYCGALYEVDVIDGATNELKTTIACGDVNTAVCYDSRDDRIYCTTCNSPTMAVIDGAADSVIATLPAGGPYLQQGLCYNWRDDKAYCTDESSDPPIVYVVDCAADTVAGKVPASCTSICYNGTDDVAYCRSGGVVAIVDGSTQRVVGAVACSDLPYALCYVPQRNKVYCACYSSYAVAIVDAESNVLLSRITTGLGSRNFCCNSQGSKVYCVNGLSGTMTVIDALADTVLTTFPGIGWDDALCYNSRHDEIYCAGDSAMVAVVDATADTVLRSINVGFAPSELEFNSMNDKVYALLGFFPAHGVAVIDADADTVRARLDLGVVSSSCFSPVKDRVYFSSSDSGYVAVADGVSDSILTTIRVGQSPRLLCYDSRDDRAFCTTKTGYVSDSLVAIDCATNTVVATIRVPEPQNLLYNPDRNRVYCTSSDTVTVIDASTATIVMTVDVGGTPGAMVWDSAQSRLYVANKASYISVLRDLGAGIQEGRESGARTRPSPTVICGVLFLPETVGGRRLAVSACLLDISGRKVLDLHPGANDVRALAPGVYFVREWLAVGGGRSAIRKVVITR